MEKPTSEQLALEKAISLAGGKTALMRKLNELGHKVNSHNTISRWVDDGVPAKYCPAIEGLTGVMCEDLLPEVSWLVLRGQPLASFEPTKEATHA
jgi:DNA-binding transcriptional regulator YdaS (Cro superfamily)